MNLKTPIRNVLSKTQMKVNNESTVNLQLQIDRTKPVYMSLFNQFNVTLCHDLYFGVERPLYDEAYVNFKTTHIKKFI